MERFPLWVLAVLYRAAAAAAAASISRRESLREQVPSRPLAGMEFLQLRAAAAAAGGLRSMFQMSALPRFRFSQWPAAQGIKMVLLGPFTFMAERTATG